MVSGFFGRICFVCMAFGAVYGSTVKASECQDQPATKQCDDPVLASETCEGPFKGGSSGLYETKAIIDQTCRTFDGCGNFSGEWTTSSTSWGYPVYDATCSGSCYFTGTRCGAPGQVD